MKNPKSVCRPENENVSREYPKILFYAASSPHPCPYPIERPRLIFCAPGNRLCTPKERILTAGIGSYHALPQIPRSAGDRKPCSNLTWSDFVTANNARDQFQCDGIGIVLTGDGLVAIDLDHCVRWDGEHFCIEPFAFEIVRAVDSYTEFSPSRSGLHIFAVVFLPQGRRRANGFEIYDDKRFITVTGDIVSGCAYSVEQRSEQLLGLSTIFPDAGKTFSP